MTYSPKDAPAFPTGSDRSMDSRHWGMSKREHFAALILAGLHANPGLLGHADADELRLAAIQQADALLEDLNKSDREDG